jgi:hypothetical protein
LLHSQDGSLSLGLSGGSIWDVLDDTKDTAPQLGIFDGLGSQDGSLSLGVSSDRLWDFLNDDMNEATSSADLMHLEIPIELSILEWDKVTACAVTILPDNNLFDTAEQGVLGAPPHSGMVGPHP